MLALSRLKDPKAGVARRKGLPVTPPEEELPAPPPPPMGVDEE
jgi:hypothetical protein